MSHSSVAVMELHDQNQEFTLACGPRSPGACNGKTYMEGAGN